MHYIILCSTKDLHDTDLFHSSHLIEFVQNTHNDGHTQNVTFLEIIMTSKEIAIFYGITAENRIKVYSLKLLEACPWGRDSCYPRWYCIIRWIQIYSRTCVWPACTPLTVSLSKDNLQLDRRLKSWCLFIVNFMFLSGWLSDSSSTLYVYLKDKTSFVFMRTLTFVHGLGWSELPKFGILVILFYSVTKRI